MNFADRVVRFKKKQARLGDLDVSGMEPEAIAAEHVSLDRSKEVSLIGPPRASSLYEACMRMHVIGTVEKKSQEKVIGLKVKLLFGIGRAVHYWIQNDPTVFEDRRIGWWLCRACDRVTHFGTPPKKICKVCGSSHKVFEYFEHSMKIDTDEHKVTGHVDLFVVRSYGESIRVVEIKTINGDAFMKLKAPLIEHTWQTLAYMWGCSEDLSLPVQIDSEIGYVFYISKKAFTKTMPVKMFPVRSDPPIMKRIKQKLWTYKDGVANYPDRLPELHRSCSQSQFNSYQARWCPCLNECRDFHGRL